MVFLISLTEVGGLVIFPMVTLALPDVFVSNIFRLINTFFSAHFHSQVFNNPIPIDLDGLSVEDIARKLTLAGLEVDEIKYTGRLHSGRKEFPV